MSDEMQKLTDVLTAQRRAHSAAIAHLIAALIKKGLLSEEEANRDIVDPLRATELTGRDGKAGLEGAPAEAFSNEVEAIAISIERIMKSRST